MVRQVRSGAAAPAPEFLPMSYPELDLQFSHVAVIFPRIALGDLDSVTYSPAALARSPRPDSLEFRTPVKSAAAALHAIGLRSLAELQTRRVSSAVEGAFTRLESLGMTLAFFGHERAYANALDALSHEYEIVSDFHIYLPPRPTLATVPETRGLSTPAKHEWPEGSGILHAWERGIRGANVLMGVLDTGIDADHQEFSEKLVSYRYVSFFPNSPYWPPRDVRGFDLDGHGTHVCGIIAGKCVGIAPEVSLYVASVIESQTTRTSLTRILHGLNWIFQQFMRPDNANKPAVLNMSLGFPTSSPSDISEEDFEKRIRNMRLSLRTLAQSNVLAITAIGNEGAGKLNYPGAFDEVIGVGAVDFEGRIAGFSGSGTVQGKIAKPDLVGYGVGVYSSVERDYLGNAIYQRFSGTSMAAPYVAGIAALYRCQDPNLSLNATQQRLMDSCEPLSGQPKDRIGRGLARFRL